MKILSASLSDVGRVRRQNEDSLAILPAERLFLVADGMGGHAGGKRASQTAVEAVAEYLRSRTEVPEADASGAPGGVTRGEVVDAIRTANRRILEVAAGDASLHGMGTTVAALVVDADTQGAVVHVGDSRVYRLRGDRLEQLTVDHSLVADLVRRGEITEEQAKKHPYRHTLTRALGAAPVVAPEVQSVDLAEGDLFVLCSDGISGMIDDEPLRSIAIAHRNDPAALCRALVDEANARGGKDNATVIVVLCAPG